MEFKDRVCCMCDKCKKFLARINAGQKFYCMQCQAKITKEHGRGYWKPCSFEEFLRHHHHLPLETNTKIVNIYF